MIYPHTAFIESLAQLQSSACPFPPAGLGLALVHRALRRAVLPVVVAPEALAAHDRLLGGREVDAGVLRVSRVRGLQLAGVLGVDGGEDIGRALLGDGLGRLGRGRLELVRARVEQDERVLLVGDGREVALGDRARERRDPAAVDAARPRDRRRRHGTVGRRDLRQRERARDGAGDLLERRAPVRRDARGRRRRECRRAGREQGDQDFLHVGTPAFAAGENRAARGADAGAPPSLSCPLLRGGAS
ncbi:unnamed protein product [Pelagomonas calceolata]|uniref:Uncharacterized protein n=1 Tax=Pelagomonas calceolata TaxID=35677 RepID=A0A8J2SHE8_9STRA|nr:unnamed protein product [Pelagomonas calceolata]